MRSKDRETADTFRRQLDRNGIGVRNVSVTRRGDHGVTLKVSLQDRTQRDDALKLVREVLSRMDERHRRGVTLDVS